MSSCVDKVTESVVYEFYKAVGCIDYTVSYIYDIPVSSNWGQFVGTRSNMCSSISFLAELRYHQNLDLSEVDQIRPVSIGVAASLVKSGRQDA